MLPKTTVEPDIPSTQPPSPCTSSTDLPPRSTPPPPGQPRKSRTCWVFSLSSYSLRNVDAATRARRVAMLGILALRAALSALSCVQAAVTGRVDATVVCAVLGVLGLSFIAWCLARIGDSLGERLVLGVLVGRWHLDVFLFVCAFIHVGLVVTHFFWWSWGLQLIWLAMWPSIFAAAWIAGWEPEDPGSNV